MFLLGNSIFSFNVKKEPSSTYTKISAFFPSSTFITFALILLLGLKTLFAKIKSLLNAPFNASNSNLIFFIGFTKSSKILN